MGDLWRFLVIQFFFLLLSNSASAQCNWSRRTILPEKTRDQPALAVFNALGEEKLILAFTAADYSDAVYVISSADGFKYRDKVHPDQALSIRGVALAASPQGSCGCLYLAFQGMDTNSTVRVARSKDGLHWSQPVYAARFSEFTPVLIGAHGRGVDSEMALAYSVVNPDLETNSPVVATRGFNCDLSLISEERFCFLGSGACATFRSSGPPAWSIRGDLELRAIAQPNGDPILYEKSGQIRQAEGPSDTGVSAAIDPASNQGYLAWAESGSNNLTILNVDTGKRERCGDYTFSPPTITFFKNQLFLAWRGGPDDAINIAAMKAF